MGVREFERIAKGKLVIVDVKAAFDCEDIKKRFHYCKL